MRAMWRTTMLMGAVLGLALTGCGGESGTITAADDTGTTETTLDPADDSGAGSGGSTADVDALAEALTRADLGVPEDQARCAAELMAADLSSEGIGIVVSPSGAPTDLGPADLEVVTAAFNECLDVSVFGEGAVGAFATSSGIDLTEEESTCSIEALGTEVGGAGDMMIASMDPESPDTIDKFLSAIGGCLTTDSLVTYLTGQFSADGTMDEATAGCISQALVGEYGGTDLLKNFAAAADGSLPADFEASITAAATSCATSGAVGGGIGQ